MIEQDLLFLTPDEVAAELAKMVADYRVNDVKLPQAEFAKKIGMPLRTYREFEQKGRVSLPGFISILAGIGKKDIIYKGLLRDDIEMMGIDGYLKESRVKRKKRVR